MWHVVTHLNEMCTHGTYQSNVVQSYQIVHGLLHAVERNIWNWRSRTSSGHFGGSLEQEEYINQVLLVARTCSFAQKYTIDADLASLWSSGAQPWTLR